MPPAHDVEQTDGGPRPTLRLTTIDVEQTYSERGLILIEHISDRLDLGVDGRGEQEREKRI
jgi:hypothetical protein